MQFALSEIGPELRDVLLGVVHCILAGEDFVTVDGSVDLTPSQVAERLGMSRTHLYKLLDRGEILSHRVGRERRINASDVLAFEQQRDRGRRELAERFAKQHEARAAVIDEIAELL